MNHSYLRGTYIAERSEWVQIAQLPKNTVVDWANEHPDMILQIDLNHEVTNVTNKNIDSVWLNKMYVEIEKNIAIYRHDNQFFLYRKQER